MSWPRMVAGIVPAAIHANGIVARAEITLSRTDRAAQAAPPSYGNRQLTHAFSHGFFPHVAIHLPTRAESGKGGRVGS